MRAAAERWRAGTATLVTLLTAGVFLKGPESARELTIPWRALLTVLTVAGLACATAGFWRAIGAAAGDPRPVRYADVVRRYGSVRGYQVAVAREAARGLQAARMLVAASLVLLGLAVICWWWSDTNHPDGMYISVRTTPGRPGICGRLITGDSGQLRLATADRTEPAVVPLTQVTDIRTVATCDPPRG